MQHFFLLALALLVCCTPSAPTVEDLGLPDLLQPLEVPAAVVQALGGKSYVEDSCSSATYPGWPHEAQRCTYYNGLEVTIANPTPDRVARWIVEAAGQLPALAALKTRDAANYEAGLLAIAKHTINQSSRIFPLDGEIWENGTVYQFERGVTSTCSTGCYCRINSMSRPGWCAYAASVLKSESESACLDKYGHADELLTDEWLAHCLENHITAWTRDANEHYRAHAWNANLSLSAEFPDPSVADGAAVVVALKKLYP